MSNIIHNEHLVRQADLIPIDRQDVGITIIGAGAIGSHVALSLVKSGFEDIIVFDFDEVSIENMSCQGYRKQDIGKSKVDALKEIILMYTGVSINVIAKEWAPDPQENRIVVVAVDSMKARTEIFEEIQKKCFNVEYIIDPRMGAEVAALYVMKPHKESESYKKTLYSDESAVQERCTAKATNYTANMLSGLVVKTIKNLALDEPYPRISQWNIADNSFEAWTANVQQ